jgi:DNA-binding response OmpR family regulator
MRVLLVEDEPDLGAAIQRVLHQEKYIVDWVQDGTEAWSYLESSTVQYTIAILDWLLPGTSGLELCQRLRANHDPLPVLILTAKDQTQDKVMGLDAGADDYLIKPFEVTEFLARVRALQRRSPQIQNRHLQVGRLTLDYATSTVAIQSNGNTQPILLTAKEFQLLEYFMEHPQQIVTRDQIINRLWEVQAEHVSNVVAAQVRLLRRRLAVHGCEELIETVYGLGYRLNLSNEPKSDL